MSNLFIIGNGFDLAHGIQSSYEDFHKYLRQKYSIYDKSKLVLPNVYSNKKDCSDIDAARLIERLVSIAQKDGRLWCDFENSLGRLDYSRFINFNNMDTYYVEMMRKSLEICIPKVKSLFRDWIRDIDIQNIRSIESFTNLIDIENDYFISFNYTHVLENVYGARNVCHVHGDVNNPIILGHGDSSVIKLIPIEEHKIYKKKRNKIDTRGLYKIVKEGSKKNYDKGYLTINDIGFCLHYMNYSRGKGNSVQNTLLNNLAARYYWMKSSERFYRYTHINGYLSVDDTELSSDVETNYLIREAENSLQNTHIALKKDTQTAMKTLLTFLCAGNIAEKIHNIYSIGFSYSDIDMKAIQLISLSGAHSWHLNNYKFDDLLAFKRKIMRSGFMGAIGQFDFTAYTENPHKA